MQVASKHSREWSGTLTHFTGGMDKSRPPAMIDGEALYNATNFFYDPKTGYPTTRPGLKRYSASAVGDGGSVIGVYEFVKNGASITLLVTNKGNLYYLDAGKNPVLIGALTGSLRPSFSTLFGQAVICSGAALNLYDGTTLSTTGSPTVSFISDYTRGSTMTSAVARILAVGNTTNRDRLYLSGSGDPNNWSFNASPESDAKYIDIGFQDGVDAIGIAGIRGVGFVFRKTPSGSVRRINLVNILDVSTNWSAPEYERSHGTLSPFFIVEALGDVYFVDIEGPVKLSVVPNQASYPFSFDPFGSQVAGEMAQFTGADGFSIYDPLFGIIMTKPSLNADQFYCMDLKGQRWTYFKYGLNIQCGAFCNGQMLFGATDGYLYGYDTTSSQDNGVEYLKTIETKWFDIAQIFSTEVKEKYLDLIGITAGTLTIDVKVKGAVIFTVPATTFADAWLSWAIVNTLTPAQWTESLTKNNAQTIPDYTHVKPASGVSMAINVTGGLCALYALYARIAQEEKK